MELHVGSGVFSQYVFDLGKRMPSLTSLTSVNRPFFLPFSDLQQRHHPRVLCPWLSGNTGDNVPSDHTPGQILANLRDATSLSYTRFRSTGLCTINATPSLQMGWIWG